MTEQIPKSLLEVAGRPFAEHQIELLQRHGLTNIVWCVGYLGEQIRDALGSGRRWGLQLQYAFDGQRLLGTGGALRRALPLLGEAFLVLYGDSYLECDYGAIEQAFMNSGQPGLMTVVRNDNAWDRSNVEFTNGQIVRYDKRTQTSEMHHIDYGLGALRAAAFDAYPLDQPLDLETVYQDLLAAEQLIGYEVSGRFYEIGSPRGLEETRQYLEHGL
jgi:NDP-sugar pyrophosphorylase family protein